MGTEREDLNVNRRGNDRPEVEQAEDEGSPRY